MTREEAVELLKQYNLYSPTKQIEEAVDMAIEALSADAEYADLPDIPRYYYEKVVGNMAHEINMLKEQLESADAVQGEWINREYCQVDEDAYEVATCSNCKSEITIEYPYDNYCPNCGARMKGGAG